MDGQRQAVREATWAWAPMSVYAPGQVQLLHRAQFPEALGGLDDVPGWQFSVAGLLAAAAARAQEFQHALLTATCLGVGGARRLRFSGALRTQGLRVAGARDENCVGDNVLLGALRLCTRRIHNTNINNKISILHVGAPRGRMPGRGPPAKVAVAPPLPLRAPETTAGTMGTPAAVSSHHDRHWDYGNGKGVDDATPWLLLLETGLINIRSQF